MILPICAGLGFCALFAVIIAEICFKFCKRLSGKKRPRAFRVLICVAAVLLTGSVCIFSFLKSWRKVETVAELNGTKAQIRGVVLDYPYELYNKTYYKLKISRVTINGKSVFVPEFTARISTQSPFACQPYDTVECTLSFFGFDDSGGLYSVRNSYLADGIDIGGYISDYENIGVISDSGMPIGELTVRWRHSLARSIEKQLSTDEANLIRAILLGESAQVKNTGYGDFKKIGASHILIVSGLHMTALASCFSLIFSTFHMRKPIKNLLTVAAILLFLAVIGFPVSAVRAAIMYNVILIAECLGRRADSVNSLGFAVLIICLAQPFSGGDLGFALSVLATLGVILFSDRISKALLKLAGKRKPARKIIKPIADAFGTSISATVFTLPIQAAAFGGISLLAPIASFVLVLPCTVLLYFALGAAFCGVLPWLSFLAEPLALCAGMTARFALWAASGLAKIHGAYIMLSKPIWLLVVAVWIMLWLTSHVLKNRAVSCFTFACAIAIFCVGRAFENGADSITFVANDTSVVMIKNHSAAVLTLGGYNPAAVEDILLYNNISNVELLCMPVRDPDAKAAAVTILQSFKTKTLALPEDAYVGKELITAGRRAERKYLCDDESLTVLQDAILTVNSDMSRITIKIYGVTAMVETESSGADTCTVLFTNQSHSDINSAFTVLQNNDIIEQVKLASAQADEYINVPNLKLPSGYYIFPDGDGLYCSVHKDGTISLKGESVCLK